MESRHLSIKQIKHATVIAVSKATVEGIEEDDYPDGNAVELRDDFKHAVAQAPGGIVIDIRDIAYLNHASMSLVFSLVSVVADRDKQPPVMCCSSQIKELLDTCRINCLCDCFTELTEALTELGRRPSG